MIPTEPTSSAEQLRQLVAFHASYGYGASARSWPHDSDRARIYYAFPSPPERPMAFAMSTHARKFRHPENGGTL